MAYAEFSSYEIAIFVERLLNNKAMDKTRNLIIDFSLENWRQIQKLEFKQKKVKEKVEQTKKENQLTKKKVKKGTEMIVNIAEIDDCDELKKLLENPNIHRGKRQRIKKKLKRLNGDKTTKEENEDNKIELQKISRANKLNKKILSEQNVEISGKKRQQAENIKINKDIVKEVKKKRKKRKLKDEGDTLDVNHITIIYI